MSLELTDRQRELRARARTVAREILRDARLTAERLPSVEERFLATKPAYARLITEGFLRACIPTADGGDNESLLDTAVLMEELYTENPSVALTLLATVLGVQPVLAGGDPDQRKRLLAPFLEATGAPLAAFCSTEPGGSANPAAPPPGEGVRTRAVRAGDQWVINGRKKWVSSATGWQRDGADLLTVLCRTADDAPPGGGISMLAVVKPAGVTLDRVIETSGYRAHLLPEFTFHDVATPAENLLGAEGGGLPLAGASFLGATALVGLLGVALLRAAFEHTLHFARTERRGGTVPILEHQGVGYALADAKTSIEAVRALSLRACAAVDAGHPARVELAGHAKVFGSETAVRVITDLMRVVGVDSYDDLNPLNGLLQDALVLPLFAGGNLGVRRRALHALLLNPDYDSLGTI